MKLRKSMPVRKTEENGPAKTALRQRFSMFLDPSGNDENPKKPILGRLFYDKVFRAVGCVMWTWPLR